MEVNDLIEQQDEAGSYSKEFTLWPEKWNRYERTHGCDWQCVQFSPDNVGEVPQESGVYNFVVEPGIACHPACAHVMYVGETSSLQRRYGEYIREKNNINGRPKIVRMLNKWDGYIKFYYLRIDEATREEVQDDMIVAFAPPFNDRIPSEVSGVINAF